MAHLKAHWLKYYLGVGAAYAVYKAYQGNINLDTISADPVHTGMYVGKAIALWPLFVTGIYEG